MPARRAAASVDIDAPIELVFARMLRLDEYARWNPFIVRATPLDPQSDGLAREGLEMRLTVRWPGGGGAVSRERVRTVRLDGADGPAPRTALLEYEYLGPIAALHLVRGVRAQRLAARSPTSTRYETEEVFHGLLAAFLPLAAVQAGFEAHARALKATCEAEARAGRQSILVHSAAGVVGTALCQMVLIPDSHD